MSIFSIFKRGLEKSATKVSRAVSAVFTGIKAHDAASFDTLEGMLISADFGVAAAQRTVAGIKDRYERGEIATDADLVNVAKEVVKEILSKNIRPINLAPAGSPTVILMVGVNGSGKTTTIGKMAFYWKNAGKKVILGACDTFRAAATEQLELWGERTGCQVVRANHGADPAGVACDAVKAAQARNADFLLIDTAGRQQNQRGLMAELEKIRRAIGKAMPGAPHEVWLTVDSTLGSNVLNQAREFGDTADVSGLVLTKLDGTGRGGMAAALQEEYHLPVFFVGLGEQPDELQEFNVDHYTDALFGDENK